MSNNIIELRGVKRTYRIGREELPVLRGIDWDVPEGAWSVLFGASGSGKTTLLNLIGGLERPDHGSIKAAGVELGKLSNSRLAKFRSANVGFVFQTYHLLPELSVLENVALPGRLNGMGRNHALQRARELLARVGLEARVRHRPGELSGGEQQRAAIARALINSPRLLLADEPTGNLDSRTGDEILALLGELRQNNAGLSIVMITHNREISRLADSEATLKDGVLEG